MVWGAVGAIGWCEVIWDGMGYHWVLWGGMG